MTAELLDLKTMLTAFEVCAGQSKRTKFKVQPLINIHGWNIFTGYN